MLLLREMLCIEWFSNHKRFTKDVMSSYKGPFKCCVRSGGVGGHQISLKKCYKGVRFNIISFTRE